MSEIKIGDWVEVVELDKDGDDTVANMSVGDALLVLDVTDYGGIKVRLKDGNVWRLSPGQFKKVDAPETLGEPTVNEERPASNLKVIVHELPHVIAISVLVVIACWAFFICCWLAECLGSIYLFDLIWV